MANLIADNLATPTVNALDPNLIKVPNGNSLSLTDWFISSRINTSIDEVRSYQITRGNGAYVFDLTIPNLPAAGNGFFISFLCNRDISIEGNDYIQMFDSENSNMKCWYMRRNDANKVIRFIGDQGIYLINFLNVATDQIFFLNAKWEEYECQGININGLPLNQLGIQTADWFNYEVGYSVPDKQTASRSGHSISTDGYDNEYITIPLRLDFSNLAAISNSDNAYEAAMNIINFLIDYMRDTNLYITFKQKRDDYIHCFYNSIIQLEHKHNIFKFELKLQKILNKGTSSFSLKPSTNRFKPIEFIMRSGVNFGYIHVTDFNDSSNYFHANQDERNNYMIDTMFNGDNRGIKNIIPNLNHFINNASDQTGIVEKVLYLE